MATSFTARPAEMAYVAFHWLEPQFCWGHAEYGDHAVNAPGRDDWRVQLAWARARSSGVVLQVGGRQYWLGSGEPDVTGIAPRAELPVGLLDEVSDALRLLHEAPQREHDRLKLSGALEYLTPEPDPPPGVTAWMQPADLSTPVEVYGGPAQIEIPCSDGDVCGGWWAVATDRRTRVYRDGGVELRSLMTTEARRIRCVVAPDAPRLEARVWVMEPGRRAQELQDLGGRPIGDVTANDRNDGVAVADPDGNVAMLLPLPAWPSSSSRAR